MRTRARITTVIAGAASIGLLGSILAMGISPPAAAPAASPETSPPRDNDELRRLHDDDQADRSPAGGKPIDWAVVGPRDHARLARVKALFTEDRLQTANDYYHAAMVLQHGDVPEDSLLAHEFCVVAITKGKNDQDARWLAAASEDRFLMNINRPQRFATQYRSEGAGPMKLYSVDTTVTDNLRRLMDTHSLAEAMAHEAEINGK
jgi:hypothetical protein